MEEAVEPLEGSEELVNIDLPKPPKRKLLLGFLPATRNRYTKPSIAARKYKRRNNIRIRTRRTNGRSK